MYIWEKEIKSVKDWSVEYKDWSNEFYSKDYLEYLTTKEPKTLDEFVQYKQHKIISDIMQLFINTSTKMGEMTPILQWLTASMNNAEDEALNKLYKVSHPSNITFKAINDIVLKVVKK